MADSAPYAEVGGTGEASFEVTEERLAAAYGSGSLRVFGTPGLIALVEAAAVAALAERLPAAGAETSVGTCVDVKHTAASALGVRVWARATVTAVDRKKITFEVRAFEGADNKDESKPIGSGTHDRFVVNSERFMAALDKK